MPSAQLRGLVMIEPGVDADRARAPEARRISGRPARRRPDCHRGSMSVSTAPPSMSWASSASDPALSRPIGDGLAVPERGPDIAEPLVDHRRLRLDGRRQMRADGEQRSAGMGAQIRGRALDPAGFRLAQRPSGACRDRRARAAIARASSPHARGIDRQAASPPPCRSGSACFRRRAGEARPCSAASPRRCDQARAWITWCGPGPSRSSSRLTTTSQFSSR